MLSQHFVSFRRCFLCGTIVVALVAKAESVLVAQPENTGESTDTRATDTRASDSTRLDFERLATVLHPKTGLKSLGIRDAERDAYYYVLDHARKVDYRLQKQAARRFIQQRRRESEDPRWRNDEQKPFPIFVDLFQHADDPTVYHGQLVPLEGHVRLLRQIPAGENSYGIQTLYEAWLYTEGSQNHPACIVCTSIPPKMLEAFEQSPSRILDHVSTTGYFFKMMGYAAQDTNRYAPLILAERLEWQPPVPQTPWIPRQYLAVAAVVVVFLLVGIVYRITRTDQRLRRKRLKDSLTELDLARFEDNPMDQTTDSATDADPPGVSSDRPASDLSNR